MVMDRILWVALVTGRGDPAWDRSAPNYREALVRYARLRAPEALAAIPCVPGRRPTLFGVAVLTAHARAVVLDAPGTAERALLAVRAGVVAIRRPDQPEERPVYESAGSELGRLAPPSWAERIAEVARGAWAIDELGAVVLHRAEFGDPDEGDGDPLDRYALPAGARLAL
jgi:hypothetical protein